MPATRTTRRGNGAGKGDGWGGPAKGASTSRITAETAPMIQPLSNDRDVKAAATERLQAVKDRIFHLAMHAAREETQLSAAIAYANREEGTPIARSITVATDDLASLSDAELAERLAHLERVAAAAGTGAAQAPGPRQPRGVVN